MATAVDSIYTLKYLILEDPRPQEDIKLEDEIVDPDGRIPEAVLTFTKTACNAYVFALHSLLKNFDTRLSFSIKNGSIIITDSKDTLLKRILIKAASESLSLLKDLNIRQIQLNIAVR